MARMADVYYGDLDPVNKEDAFYSPCLAEGIIKHVDTLRGRIIIGL